MSSTNSSRSGIPRRLRAEHFEAVADVFGVRPTGDRLRVPCPVHNVHNGGDANLSVWVDDEDFLAFDCKSHQCKGIHDRVRELVVEGAYDGGGTPPKPRPPVPLPTPEQLAAWGQEMRTGAGDVLDAQLDITGWSEHRESLAEIGVGHDGERIVFPISDAEGALVGVTRYAPGAPIKSLCGRGQKRGLYPSPESIESTETFLFEGEPDAVTANLAGLPAVGVPGKGGWKADWTQRFAGRTVYVCFDCADDARAAGDKIVAELLEAGISAARIELDAARSDGYDFKDHTRVHGLAAAADHVRGLPSIPPVQDATVQHPGEDADRCTTVAPTVAPAIASDSALLSRIEEVLQCCGLIGEEQNAKVIYLAVTSRLLHRPVAVGVKGVSSGGKSFIVETVLRLFPDHAYYALSAMSERALAYSKEPLSHRVLVIYEAVGMSGDLASYLLRSLLSEGRVRYETVQKTKQGMQAILIEREGPTGLIVTTTRVSLHPENETRMLSLTVADTRAQTKAVLKALADEGRDDAPDLSEWHQLQDWLASEGPHEVVVPFAGQLAEKMPPVAVRLRRDFTALLGLIKAHALLHRATRELDDDGRIVATVDDYAVVRALVADVISEGIQATVSPCIRETVEAVQAIYDATSRSVNQAQLADALQLDKSTVSRRVKVALDAGYLANLEERLGRPARYVPGAALPEDVELLPPASELQQRTPRRRPGGALTTTP